MAKGQYANKIYGAMNPKNMDSNVYSKNRVNHENLLSSSVADEFNTYRTWASFNLAVDVDPLTSDDFEEDGSANDKGEKFKMLKKAKDRKKVESTGVRSIFNKLHAVPLENESYGWRVSQNMPLLDSPKTRQLQRSMNACTVRDLVQKSHAGLLGTSMYEYSDFMFCKYLGRVPNNYLITLRRFTIPVTDYIKPYGNPTAINGTGAGPETTTKTDSGGVPMGCMVTWLGTPGNEMGNIMKYSFSMPFKSVNSKFESDGSPGGQAVDRNSGGAIGSAFSKAFSTHAAQRCGNIIMPGVFNRRHEETMSYPGPHYDANKAYSGVDMIKSIYVRDGERGLSFDQKFTLTFDYELRSYDGVNGKQAMLDLLGNILTVCYTTGDFWGGAYRHEAGSSSMQPMSSLECMRYHNTFSEYVGAFQRDFHKVRGRITNALKDPIGTIMNLLDNLGGLLLGGDENLAPMQVTQSVNALLSDSAVGFWHVTVGNPCAPMMSIGNLIMTNCTVEHYGPLGIDDFPTGLRVTCEFDSGKPRDKRLIERMYNGGNDRIYMPLDQSVFELLENAKKINQKNAEGTGGSSGKKSIANKGPKASIETTKQVSERAQAASAAVAEMMNGASVVSAADDVSVNIISNLNQSNLVKRLFGTTDKRGIEFTSGEMAEGAPGVSNSIDTEVNNSGQ